MSRVFLHGQDSLVQARLKAEQTAFTVFRPVDVGVAVEAEIHFSQNALRANLHAFPTGLAAPGIQADIKCLRMTRKGEVKCHSLLL
jgi:hypothetical protein